MAPGAAAADTSTHAYGEASYWDQRYSKDRGTFDWYQKYQSLGPLFDLYLRRHHRLLLVGCGNSGPLPLFLVSLLGTIAFAVNWFWSLVTELSVSLSEIVKFLTVLGESMVDDGYQDVVNIDISSVVIEAMQEKYSDRPRLKYIKMDVREMSSFESSSFDAVIDKGTLDSLMCGPNATENATKMLKEVGRVLNDKGVYILITYGDPSYRLNLLRGVELWNINMHVIELIIVPPLPLLFLPDRTEKTPGQKAWELTTPLPLNEDGSSVSAVLGSNPEVHYIYVCIKGECR
ncbi:hypothetical protein ZIOFF_072388 [Zingiber officinale]|uniref:Methyltransferase type 11 domain-containing protein n=1 Tax=Zingiber officinale TaxID=94328 RepID=A0A8J5CAW1_ZINOF|nr:hypothetical protein ZIOFF_072388 [Zingiber officinale]